MKRRFEDIPELELPKEMLDLATRIVNTKSGHFDASQFQDRYENALIDLVPVGNSNTPILVVQPAQNGRDEDMAARLDGAWDWRVFAYGQVSARLIVIPLIRAQQIAKMRLAEDND
jgi:hypothetical protein